MRRVLEISRWSWDTDLLAGNVLVLDPDEVSKIAKIQLTDYEYSVSCNVAFDIALHFGEWAGFEYDYTKVPSPQLREAFFRE